MESIHRLETHLLIPGHTDINIFLNIFFYGLTCQYFGENGRAIAIFENF